MSERLFRLVLGTSLILFLFLGWDLAVYGYICVVLFEGITNWRIPILVSRLRYGTAYAGQSAPECRLAAIDFDAERVLRVVIAAFLFVSFVVFRDALWFFPWFVGFALVMAGISGICPMAMLIRKLGFK